MMFMPLLSNFFFLRCSRRDIMNFRKTRYPILPLSREFSGSACSEVSGSRDDIRYLSTDENVVKDSRNWQSVTNLSELQVTPNREMLYEQHFVSFRNFLYLKIL